METTNEQDGQTANRRSFMKTGAAVFAAGTVSATGASLSAADQSAARAGERIREVRAFIRERGIYDNADLPREQDAWTNTMLISAPMAVYPEYHDDRRSWGKGVLGSVIVEIEDESGRTGYGLSSCGIPGAFIIEHHFKRFLTGSYPHQTEKLWDQMWRSSMHYGRKGLPIMATSAVDLALWDLLGKQRQEPVYALIGGKVKDEIHMYATTPNAEYAKSMGFWGAKMALPHGPADGRAGLLNNLRMAQEARAKVGDDFELMFDCWMSLDVPYTIELARVLEPVRIKWLEEFLPPDDYDGLADVRKSVRSCWLTTGEHEYTRFGFLEILKRRSIDVLQPDLTWCGGLTEALKIAHMAKAYNVPVVPHVSSMFSYHFAMAQTNCPFTEFIILGPRGDKVVPVFGDIFTDEPLPVNGRMRLSDKPGWGLTLNPGLNLKRPFTG